MSLENGTDNSELPGRWIVIFDGPAKDKRGHRVVRAMGEDDCVISMFRTYDAAKGNLKNHMMRDYARWILNVDTGDCLEA